MLNEVLEQLQSIQSLLTDANAVKCKLFGKAINIPGLDDSADLNFLITPGPYLSEPKWQTLQEKLSGLFPRRLIICYTPESLVEMVEEKEISRETVETINTTAISLAKLAKKIGRPNEAASGTVKEILNTDLHLYQPIQNRI